MNNPKYIPTSINKLIIIQFDKKWKNIKPTHKPGGEEDQKT